MTTSAGGWTVALVAVTPQQNAAPERETLDALTASSISFTDDLNGPGEAEVVVPPRTLRKVAAEALVDPGAQRVDIEIIDPGGVTRWAGKVRSEQCDPSAWSLGARGHEALLDDYGLVDLTETYTDVDQHYIVRDVIDGIQSRAWGHLGLDTSAIIASGVTRKRTWKMHEDTSYGQLLRNLSAVLNGFDLWVRPDRQVRCEYPQRGTDRSADILVAAPAIKDGSIERSVAPGDFATEVLAVGTQEGNDPPLLSLVANLDAQQRHGTVRHTVSADGVTEQATLDDIADEALRQRLGQLVVPTGRLLPVVGVDLDAFDVGDSIGWSYDAGAGLESFVRRVRKRTVNIGPEGLTQTVELA